LPLACQHECGCEDQEALQKSGGVPVIFYAWSRTWTAVVDSPTSDDYTNNLNDLEVEHRPSICQNLVSLEKIVEIVHLSISKYSVVIKNTLKKKKKTHNSQLTTLQSRFISTNILIVFTAMSLSSLPREIILDIADHLGDTEINALACGFMIF
jgi:hypothetical protein